ncbi:MAG: PHP domain-containing protein, partial [Pseudomonadota bacterium]|nr:PHP domain-containing protein [Pseudomonadota bacterium]
MISIDLHSHSTASDGLLSPTELIKLAAGSGVKVLALTDHDDVSGLPEAALAALTYGVQLVNGVEISASWHGHTLHIVGLHIDPLNSTLSLGLEKIRAGRKIRARRIADSLAEAGIVGAFEGARRYAGNPHILNRSHFARYLVEAGYAKNVKAVFEHFLTGGKPGYVRH